MCSFDRCFSSAIKLSCKEHYIRTSYSKNILTHLFIVKTKTRFFYIFGLISIFKKFKRGSVHFFFSLKCCQDYFCDRMKCSKVNSSLSNTQKSHSPNFCTYFELYQKLLSFEGRPWDNFPIEIYRRNSIKIWSFWSIFFCFLTLDAQNLV